MKKDKIEKTIAIAVNFGVVGSYFVEIPKVTIQVKSLVLFFVVAFTIAWFIAPDKSENPTKSDVPKESAGSAKINESRQLNFGKIMFLVIIVAVGFLFGMSLFRPLTQKPPTNDDTNTSLAVPEKLPEVGDVIRFGAYEQDCNQENGKEAIEWLVLDTDGEKVFLVSEKALDCQPYHSERVDVTWERCSLRQWLNGSFYDSAFNTEEQELIISTEVVAERNPKCATPAGENTSDKIFLLSIDETLKYLPKDSKRMCNPTPYAISKGAYINNDTGGSWWWLRTPGNSSKDAASVNSDGCIDYDDGTVTSEKGTVRPAMWIYWK